MAYLDDYALSLIDDHERNKKVSDFVTEGNWDVTPLLTLLPRDVVNRILGIRPPYCESGNDFPFWKLTPKGKFSLSSSFAGQDLEDRPDNHRAFDWSLI